MLKPSKKMLFAIEAVLDIAYHAGGEPVQSREITRRQDIPRRYLEQTLQQLVRAGILAGVRGPKGGYKLAREKRLISVGSIIRVIQDLEGEGDPMENLPGSELGFAVVRPLWRSLSDEVFQKFDSISIEDLCNRAYSAGIPSELAQNMDFSI